MRTVEEHRGHEIVETDWTTSVKVGRDREEVRPVIIIPGLKERPSSPFLTSIAEAREYIDEELAGREAVREARTIRWRAVVRYRGNSLAVTIPAKEAKALGVQEGDEVDVEVYKR